MRRKATSPDRDNRRFQTAIALFDQANAEDPARERVGEHAQPAALVYARRMTDRLERFAPEASEPLRLAIRSQHIRRWAIPRSEFPEGRTGYRRWRTAQAAAHADTAGALLAQAGYGPDVVTRVQQLLRKERLATDPDTQALEDVACLVFLEHYAPAFARGHDEVMLLRVLGKTWRKMSDRGRTAAQQLDLAPEVRDLVRRAVISQTATSSDP